MDYIRACRLANRQIQIKDEDVQFSTHSTKHTGLVKEPSTTSTVKCAFPFAKTKKDKAQRCQEEDKGPVEEGRVTLDHWEKDNM
jgi:hypothetical protein